MNGDVLWDTVGELILNTITLSTGREADPYILTKIKLGNGKPISSEMDYFVEFFADLFNDIEERIGKLETHFTTTSS